MYDGISDDAAAIAAIPSAIGLVAGYDDGDYAWAAADWDRFPNSVHVHIAVHASTNSGSVLDVENGDATPADAVSWVLTRRAAGADPSVYCNQGDPDSGWPAVRAAFQGLAVPEPHYWVAAYVSDPSRVPAVPAGAVALQYYDFGDYDASVVVDYWPGVDDPQDAPPMPPVPPVAPVSFEEDPMQIEPVTVHPGEYALVAPSGLGTLALVADGYGNPAAGVRLAIWAGSSCTVLDDVTIGGASGVHTFGHTLPPGCTGVTVRRLDAQAYPVGIGFRP
jgi:hypothetical protein